MTPGPRNLITDVAGITVGNASDPRVKTGVTAILCDSAFAASVQVLGGAPGTRETDLLEPHATVPGVDALVLSGGSAFGLDAASGVQNWLAARGRGFIVGSHRIPIVPAAILFDLINGGDKGWGDDPPYRKLGHAAAQVAGTDFALGTAGAGTGALTAGLKGGLGSASAITADGVTIGALVAVNAVGGVTFGPHGHFWAAPFEKNGEFGGRGLPPRLPVEPDAIPSKLKMAEEGRDTLANTTIGVIATDAILSKAEAKRMAIAAHDGFSRAIWPAHTPMDGDLVFALATGASGRLAQEIDMLQLGATAAAVMARAIARGIYEATAAEGDLMPTWRAVHGG